jgi:rare lipoprotein A (peptidoglycan hydrolase)
VNDRWNGGTGRILNLSSRAARELGFGSSSMMPVRIEVEQLGSPRAVSRPAPRRESAGAVASAVPFSAVPRPASRSEECADQAKILGLENEWAERHVRSCMANRPKK